MIINQSNDNKTKMKTILKILVVATVGLCSCSSSKDFVYLQDMYSGQRFEVEKRHEAVVHPDDRLQITVSCKQPELAVPFNAPGGGMKVGADGEVSVQSATDGQDVARGYRVDSEGNIIFPILGKLRVEGLTLKAVGDTIRALIIAGDYIKDPLVSVDLLNFHYTVLGAVSHNGTFGVDGDRVTLLEALATAGGLSANARVNSVAVIREEDGERRMYVHDLRSHDLFASPCYYLRQNDIVYVEPKYMRKDLGDKAWQYLTGTFSLISAVSTIIWATK